MITTEDMLIAMNNTNICFDNVIIEKTDYFSIYIHS